MDFWLNCLLFKNQIYYYAFSKFNYFRVSNSVGLVFHYFIFQVDFRLQPVLPTLVIFRSKTTGPWNCLINIKKWIPLSRVGNTDLDWLGLFSHKSGFTYCGGMRRRIWVPRASPIKKAWRQQFHGIFFSLQTVMHKFNL